MILFEEVFNHIDISLLHQSWRVNLQLLIFFNKFCPESILLEFGFSGPIPSSQFLSFDQFLHLLFFRSLLFGFSFLFSFLFQFLFFPLFYDVTELFFNVVGCCNSGGSHDREVIQNIFLSCETFFHVEYFFLVSILFIVIMLVFFRNPEFPQNIRDSLAIYLEVVLADEGIRIKQLIFKVGLKTVVIDCPRDVDKFSHQFYDVVCLFLLDPVLVIDFFCQLFRIPFMIEVHWLRLGNLRDLFADLLIPIHFQ